MTTDFETEEYRRWQVAQDAQGLARLLEDLAAAETALKAAQDALKAWDREQTGQEASDE